MYKSSLIIFALITLTNACSKKEKVLNFEAQRSEESQAALAEEIAHKKNDDGQAYIQEETEAYLGNSTAALIAKSQAKRLESSLFRTNEAIVKAYGNHTKIYPFAGIYRVMVIPVEFQDAKFADPSFFKKNTDGNSPAQDYIFGKSANSMTTYYKHASLGRLQLEGEVTTPITVSKNLAHYGEAVTNSNDKDARALVVEALKQLKTKVSEDWWLNFDSWDLSDYDRDTNFHESDGFIDAVVLIYAGKAQSSCQRTFDPKGLRPASADVPEGPRKEATVECFNRIWPHRWSIALSSDHEDYSAKGPVVEGYQRPSMNGLKITDEVYALDYNMQSEFSDRSTFIHEFGHSLSLPDVYSRGHENSSGSWEVMSSTTELQAQEMGSYSKISLGWLQPKVIEQGEKTSAYLGVYNYVANEQRENYVSYSGPDLSKDEEHILSIVPEFGEDVYRSLMVVTEPTDEQKKVVDFPATIGKRAAYSSQYNGESKSLSYKFKVAENDDAKISFDTIYFIETETNFSSKDEDIKVITDYDLGQIVINDKVVEELRLISGDNDFDSLAEENPSCNTARVKELRKSVMIQSTATEDEKKEFQDLVKICQAPIWTKKVFDLSAYKGQDVEFKIVYTTDAGYTEFGIVIDNVKLPSGKIIDFEAGESTGEFTELVGGEETLSYSQFYLFEYRSPNETFSSAKHLHSLNMDKHIQVGTQSYFLENDKNVLERFRMVTYDYQPGVLVWYFNSKFERGPSGNDPYSAQGKGYLLTIDPKVEELILPGIFSDSKNLSAEGNYPEVDLEDGINNDFETLVKKQRDEFVCFSHTKYATYINGEAPICSGDYVDYMPKITFNGKNMYYRRELFNDVLPNEQHSTQGIGDPFRLTTTLRVGLSTFRPEGSEDFKPFKVYKVENDVMVLDHEESDKTIKVAAVSSFKDSDQNLSANKYFHGDSAMVEKKGFSFRVTAPHKNALKAYDAAAPSDSNDNYLRRPRAKVYFDWE
jgi:immune inhibitor A